MSELGKRLISALEESKEKGFVELITGESLVELRERTKLSQKKFANTYHINVETLRNWEQGNRCPDSTSMAYLSCIAKDPKIIDNLLNGN